DDEKGAPNPLLRQDRRHQIQMALLAVVEGEADTPGRNGVTQRQLPAFFQSHEGALLLLHPANLAAELVQGEILAGGLAANLFAVKGDTVVQQDLEIHRPSPCGCIAGLLRTSNALPRAPTGLQRRPARLTRNAFLPGAPSSVGKR